MDDAISQILGVSVTLKCPDPPAQMAHMGVAVVSQGD